MNYFKQLTTSAFSTRMRKHTLSTDDFAELFTCAPLRAIFLFFCDWNVVATPRKPKNYGVKKTDWAGWTSFIEGQIDELMVVEDDPVSL